MSWLGWVIIAALIAGLILIPPAEINHRNYGRELASWTVFLLITTFGAGAILGLLYLAVHLIKN